MNGPFQRALALVAGLLVTACGERKSIEKGEGARTELQGFSEAERILRGAHFLTSLPPLQVTGRLVTTEGSLAVGLSRHEGQLEVVYKDSEEGGAVRIHSRIEAGRLEVFEMIGGEAWHCSAGRLGELIAGTDFSHEDLMMPWLLWPGGTLIGEEMVDGRLSWRLRVRNPERRGAYGQVEVWVDQQTGGLHRALCADGEGRPVKQFEALDVQRVGSEGCLVRRGRLDRLDPETREVLGSSYLVLDGARLLGAVEAPRR